MMKTTKDKMYVYISINGFKMDVAEIEKKIGFKHTSVNRKGDPIGSTKLKYKKSKWEYRVYANSHFSLDKLISKIFKKFKNQKALKMLSKIGDPEIVCVFHSRERLPELSISNKNIKIMADSGISFWIDYYFLEKGYISWRNGSGLRSNHKCCLGQRETK